MIQFDFLRATEMAALHCLPWIGKGDKEAADAAACDAIRGVFDVMDIRGEVILGEGIKDESPGLFAGERVGRWRAGAQRVDIAIDPLDGTTNVSRGLPNSISCIAVAIREHENIPALQHVPAFYMKKLAYPSAIRRAWIQDGSLPLDINAPIKEVISLTARLLGKHIRDVVVMVLDRPRNAEIVEESRSVGAQLRMILDGDITAALAPAIQATGVDLYAGIGGAPEGILAAAGLRCMGGGMQAQMCPRDDQERESLKTCGWNDRVEKVYRSRDLVQSNDVLFIATGIAESPLLRGVQQRGSTATTHSVLMRQHSGTIRFVNTEHNLAQRPLHLRSSSPTRPVSANDVAGFPAAPHFSSLQRHRSENNAASELSTNKKASCILLFGAPGSGKGTIGKALGTLPGFTHISSGDVIRAAVRNDPASPERWKQVSSGALISDDDLWKLFDEHLDRHQKSFVDECNEHLLVIDGIPRCRSQVVELSKRVDVRCVFHLDCSDPSTIVGRLNNRFRLDARRDDASIQVILDRLRIFREQTLPLLQLYPETIVYRIDGTARPERVLNDVLQQLGKLQSWHNQPRFEADISPN